MPPALFRSSTAMSSERLAMAPDRAALPVSSALTPKLIPLALTPGEPSLQVTLPDESFWIWPSPALAPAVVSAGAPPHETVRKIGTAVRLAASVLAVVLLRISLLGVYTGQLTVMGQVLRQGALGDTGTDPRADPLQDIGVLVDRSADHWPDPYTEPTRQAEISYAVFCLKKKKKLRQSINKNST